MGGPTRRKRTHKNDKHTKKKYRARRRQKDIDQIQKDLEPNSARSLLHRPVDTDLPGAGQHYCIACARNFIGDSVLQKHLKSKPHKRRLHALQEPMYTQREADAAAGVGCYQLPPPPNPASNAMVHQESCLEQNTASDTVETQ